jgi:POT family proton-dependent oligopeptide transporter
LQQDELINWALIIASIIIFSYFIYEIFRAKDRGSRQKMIVAIILLIYAIVFFIIYQQKNTSLMLFNTHHVNLLFLGININPQSTPGLLSTGGIILLSPFFAKLYKKLGDNDLSMPHKFSLGLTLSSSAYGVLYLVCLFTNPLSKINFGWEIFAISILFSSAELLVSALGVSLMAKLVPEHLRGFSMGMWFIASALGLKLGSIIASFAASHNLNDKTTTLLVGAAKVTSFKLYQELFGTVFITGLIISIIAWIIGKYLNQMLIPAVEEVN